MILIDQVPSLELSKRLKELGVEQESEFFWYLPYGNENNAHISSLERRRMLWVPPDISSDLAIAKESIYYSAFTVAELGEMLPFCLKMPDDVVYPLKLMKNTPDEWYTQYKLNQILYVGTEARTMGDSMAKMLIYLIEYKLIELP